jgi:DNA ligase-1
MGDSLINKVIPDLIPTFDCALATNFEDVEADFQTQTWFASRKLDGVRCLAIVDDDGDVTLWSRQGNQFETLGKVVEAVKALGLRDQVFDGEICLVDANGNEDFQGIMKQIRRKDHTIANPKYLIFDILSGSEFRARKGTVKYSTRYEVLTATVKESQYLSVVRQIALSDSHQFSSMMADADAKGWEGLILRNDVGYEGKRGKNMLKSKSFLDAEYTVVRAEFGPFRMIENGKEVTKDVLTNVIVMHKGNEVSVGSGFTIEERDYYKQRPNEIVGSVITVKYFQESKNQDGKYSLRFPTVKVIHGNSRTV